MVRGRRKKTTFVPKIRYLEMFVWPVRRTNQCPLNDPSFPWPSLRGLLQPIPAAFMRTRLVISCWFIARKEQQAFSLAAGGAFPSSPRVLVYRACRRKPWACALPAGAWSGFLTRDLSPVRQQRQLHVASCLTYRIRFLSLKNFDLLTARLTSIDLPFKDNFLMHRGSVLTTGTHLCIMEMYGSGAFTVCHCHCWELIGRGRVRDASFAFQEALSDIYHWTLFIHSRIDCDDWWTQREFFGLGLNLTAQMQFFLNFEPNLVVCTTRLITRSSYLHLTPLNYVFCPWCIRGKLDS